MALSESRGFPRRRTAGSRHLEDDECGQGAAGTGETLDDMVCNRSRRPGADKLKLY